MKEAFGCATLRTGTLIIGWLGLVAAILQFLHVLAVALELKNHSTNAGSDSTPEGYFPNGPSTQLGANMLLRSVIPFILYGSLVYGAYMKRRALLIPFMIAQLMVVVSIAVIVIYQIVLLPATFVGILISLLALALSGYCFCIVWNYYDELKTEHLVPVVVVQKNPA